jgi:stage IV sporulation protein FB
VLGEPPRTAYDLNFRLLGIPVRVHPFFWLIGLLLAPRNGGPAAILVWMVAFFLGVLCHEVGHALVMRSQGGSPWITLYGLGGLASCDRMRNARTAAREELRQIAVSAAGPLAGFLLAAVALVLVRSAGYELKYHVGPPYGLIAGTSSVIGTPHFSHFINDLLFVTIVYGILNLLPIYPLDGGQIARAVFVMLVSADGVRHSLILSTIVAGGLAVVSAAKWQDFFLAVFFGFLAYASFATLQAYSDRRPW